MSAWRIGDRALCIDGTPGELRSCPEQTAGYRWVDDGFNVEKGTLYMVHAVFDTQGGRLFLAVRDKEARDEEGWDQSRFRKVVPACDCIEAKETGLIPHEGFWQSREAQP